MQLIYILLGWRQVLFVLMAWQCQFRARLQADSFTLSVAHVSKKYSPQFQASPSSQLNQVDRAFPSCFFKTGMKHHLSRYLLDELYALDFSPCSKKKVKQKPGTTQKPGTKQKNGRVLMLTVSIHFNVSAVVGSASKNTE